MTEFSEEEHNEQRPDAALPFDPESFTRGLKDVFVDTMDTDAPAPYEELVKNDAAAEKPDESVPAAEPIDVPSVSLDPDIPASLDPSVMPDMLFPNLFGGFFGSAQPKATVPVPAPEPSNQSAPAPAKNPQQPPHMPSIASLNLPFNLAAAFGAQQQNNEQQEINPGILMYADIAGFDRAVERMRDYGFEAAGDERYRSFVHAVAEKHGVSGLSLFEPFIFYGESREDTADFAEATAGEIGFPLLEMTIELDVNGTGSIKLSGPFKRSLLGQPDFSDIPSPCTFLIHNADLLFDLFDAISRNANPESEEPNPADKARYDVFSYINMVLSKSDVFIIATARDPHRIGRPLLDLVGPSQYIEIALPDEDELRAVWAYLNETHPSLEGFDFESLIELVGGISRRDLAIAAHSAVENAYRASLKNGRFCAVSKVDFLAELAPFVRNNEQLYQAIEDATAEAFLAELL